MHKRLKIFVAICTTLLLICLIRLGQMQLASDSFYRAQIENLRKRPPQQLPTVRGKILDRKNRTIAADEPQFKLCLNYKLTRLLDKRFWQVKTIRKAAASQNQTDILTQLRKDYADESKKLHKIINKCARFLQVEPTLIEKKIDGINDRVWKLRTFLAWGRNCSQSKLHKKYEAKWYKAGLAEATAEFEQIYPDPVERLVLIDKVNIAEMHKNWPIAPLKTDDDVLAARLEFIDTDEVTILPESKRVYPYKSAASQVIGWVGPTPQQDLQLFAEDPLTRYLYGEVCGRIGIERICEPLLRGRRGQVIYDIDRKLIDRTERQFGTDVQLAVDIELQERIEKYIADKKLNPNSHLPTAAVVIDVKTAEILAIVSLPAYDLNSIRQKYNLLLNDSNQPLRNRAIEKHYPPGSIIKPLILIAGLESGKINPHETISCSGLRAPRQWPNCWITTKESSAHDWQFEGYGGNIARNAIKGSCNIYFSRLADRIDSAVLQNWLYKFGYGRKALISPAITTDAVNQTNSNKTVNRNFTQATGQIWSGTTTRKASGRKKLPNINAAERRLFGIGQGNLRITPLQAANAMATISRGGIYISPRLFLSPNHEDVNDSQNLGISPATLSVVRDGMDAVVNESGGTAFSAFAHSGFARQDVKVFGKTGSTEKPYNAWFAGFAEDSSGRAIAVAVVVEKGQRGSTDTAPLARDIIQFCIDAGYLGKAN